MSQKLTIIAAALIVAAAIIAAAVLPRYLDQRAKDRQPSCIGPVSAAKVAELGCKP